MTKLHIFDMDGTILEGSACLHLSEHLGCLDELNVIEEAWGRGEVGHVEFYELCLPLWQELDAPGVASVFATSPWRRNVENVFKDIAARGEHSAVITLSPLFFVDGLKAWGATTTHGADIGPGRALDPALVLTPDGKVEIAETLMQHYGIGREDVIAYGDSASDIPLFQTLGHTVSVNGSERLRVLAAASYEGDDIWEAYMLGRSVAAI